MTEDMAPDRQDSQKSFEWIIPFAGGVLVLFSIAMFAIYAGNPDVYTIAIALFGVGCAALWFGIVHFDTQKTDDKIGHIKDRADRVMKIVERSKK